MKRLNILKSGRLGLKNELTLFLIDNKINIPNCYRDFLLNQNPYTVKENLFRKDGESYEIHHFYPFDKEMELSVQFSFMNLNDFFESNYIAFADDSGGWQFVISVQKSDFGKVYFCRMDEALEDALTLLADSFEEFIDGLEIEP